MAASMHRRRWRCKFNVIYSSNERHPLHLSVAKDVFDDIVGTNGESNTIIALERCNSFRSASSGGRLFAVLQDQVDLGTAIQHTDSQTSSIRPDVQVSNPSQPEIYHEVSINCSEKFLAHYRFNRNDEVYFTLPHTVALDKIVVGVSTSRAFAWVKSVLFSRGLLLAICQGKVLIRQNDNLLIPCSNLYTHDDNFSRDFFFEMKVLYCEPLCQGRLSVKTEIIIMNQILDIKTLEPSTHISPSTKQDSVHNSAKSKTDLNLKTLDMSSELRISCDVKNDSDQKSSGQVQFQGTLSSQLIVLDIEEIDAMDRFVMSLIASEKVVDELNTVGISKYNLDQLGLEDGSVAEMYLYRLQEKNLGDDDSDAKGKKGNVKDSSKDSLTKTKRMVIVKTTKENVPVNKAYLSPCLRFNLCKKTSYSDGNQVGIKRPPETLREVPPDQLLDYTSGWQWHEGIPYATEIHISLIRSPTYATSTDASQMLREYFSQPRLIKKGDVLAVSAKGDGNFCNELPDGQRCPLIYFRVVRVHPALPAIHTYWADIQRTVLFQDGAMNHYIPGLMPMFLHKDQSVLPPPGLRNVYLKLKSVLQPHITHKRRPSDPVPSVLLTGAVGCGKRLLVQSVAAALNLHIHVVNTYDLCGETSASAEARVKTLMTRVTSFAPCVLLLRNIHAFGKAADGSTEDPRAASSFHEIVRSNLAEQNKHPVIVLASTHLPKQVNADMYEGFLHQINLPAPNELERREMVAEITGNSRSCCNINKARIAQRTAGFVLGDIHALVSHAHREAECRIKEKSLPQIHPDQRWNEEEDLVMAGVSVSQQDFEVALDRLQAAHSDNIGAPKIPKVSWSDVGGLAAVKADILDTIQLPLQHPELLAAGLRRSGVLLYGPPGTGKTLLAKAVATECSLNFMSVKGPELINMYVGQSEENVREVFQRARSAAPCVIFFDELDSLAPNRGRSGDSGGVMDRVVSQLLAELDGMSKSTDVFVIGATNRPDLLDPALLRPGRFDKLLYLGVSDDKEGQLKILSALTRRFHFTPGWSLSSVVESCPSNLTGADFYALCSDAMLNALKRKIAMLEQGLEVDQDKVEVDIGDFKEAVANLVPSVSEAELGHYSYVQKQFSEQKM